MVVFVHSKAMRKGDKEFRKKKNIILFIYDNKCALCHDTKLPKHVHHLNGKCYDNSAFNMVPLCHLCHIITHKTNVNFKLSYTAEQLEQLDKLDRFT